MANKIGVMNCTTVHNIITFTKTTIQERPCPLKWTFCYSKILKKSKRSPTYNSVGYIMNCLQSSFWSMHSRWKFFWMVRFIDKADVMVKCHFTPFILAHRRRRFMSFCRLIVNSYCSSEPSSLKESTKNSSPIINALNRVGTTSTPSLKTANSVTSSENDHKLANNNLKSTKPSSGELRTGVNLRSISGDFCLQLVHTENYRVHIVLQNK